VLAFLAPACDGRRLDLIVPAAWGGGDDAESGLLLLASSLGADLRVYHEAERRHFTCAPAAGVAYDTECAIPLPPGTGRIQLFLLRRNDETILPAVALPLYVP
jgi:hypothetical protein